VLHLFLIYDYILLCFYKFLQNSITPVDLWVQMWIIRVDMFRGIFVTANGTNIHGARYISDSRVIHDQIIYE
ncbi:hypothetical protein ACJX0J_006741, partial [Zea mays]